jgi:methionine biosynthesis protein MetW
MVGRGARVLDVGCGTGELLKLLETTKQVDGRGIELSQSGVNFCVAKGLSVVQGDADRDLSNYPDQAFDFAILSQTLQATQHPRRVLEELLRIGSHAIVSFPNFGHWRVRMQFLINGRMPVTRNLPEAWYDTPNIHLCTIRDFLELCEAIGAKVERAVALNGYGRRLGIGVPLFLQNLIGEQAVFLLTRE